MYGALTRYREGPLQCPVGIVLGDHENIVTHVAISGSINADPVSVFAAGISKSLGPQLISAGIVLHHENIFHARADEGKWTKRSCIFKRTRHVAVPASVSGYRIRLVVL